MKVIPLPKEQDNAAVTMARLIAEVLIRNVEKSMEIKKVNN